MPASSPQQKPQPNESWSPALPRQTVGPTYWPAALALATMLVVWGLISSLILTGFGLGLLIISLAGWICQIRHERELH